MRRVAFSLVELLVVLAIIGLLVALLLPAMQSVRESARQTSCRSNLRQIAVGVLTHVDQTGYFPYGGWGHEWVGVPGRDSERQPGGWIYNLLPFIEQAALHEVGGPVSEAGFTARLTTPLNLFNCPTRRACRLWPVSFSFPYMNHPRPGGEVVAVARGDYAINSGANLNLTFPGPLDLATGDSSEFVWPDLRGPLGNPRFAFSGISHIRSGARLRSLEDGTSGTYLVGEKYMDPSQYENGESLGDNESLVSGYCSDNHRFTLINSPPLTPAADGALLYDPRDNFRFGSAHPTGAMFAQCDGSVQLVAFDVSAEVHYRGGHVADGGAPAR